MQVDTYTVNNTLPGIHYIEILTTKVAKPRQSFFQENKEFEETTCIRSLCGNQYYNPHRPYLTQDPDSTTCKVCKKLLLKRMMEAL